MVERPVETKAVAVRTYTQSMYTVVAMQLQGVQQDGANVDLTLVISISAVLRLWFYYMGQSTECCGRMSCKKGHLSYYYKR